MYNWPINSDLGVYLKEYWFGTVSYCDCKGKHILLVEQTLTEWCSPMTECLFTQSLSASPFPFLPPLSAGFLFRSVEFPQFLRFFHHYLGLATKETVPLPVLTVQWQPHFLCHKPTLIFLRKIQPYSRSNSIPGDSDHSSASSCFGWAVASVHPLCCNSTLIFPGKIQPFSRLNTKVKTRVLVKKSICPLFYRRSHIARLYKARSLARPAMCMISLVFQIWEWTK